MGFGKDMIEIKNNCTNGYEAFAQKYTGKSSILTPTLENSAATQPRPCKVVRVRTVGDIYQRLFAV